jgi:hypothetical protein
VVRKLMSILVWLVVGEDIREADDVVIDTRRRLSLAVACDSCGDPGGSALVVVGVGVGVAGANAAGVGEARDGRPKGGQGTLRWRAPG